ncbi:hypothetical protein GCM10007276_19860 [Agaricicola taiwanensis]|uniref:DUF2065 domain-containing protein n=1 Tax=Agaricicola taiwanensis TaxID=591372 RepID=A0A8J2YHB6_9RHOB|nr:DUF2065 domain-containing protein [Agaricicola taiwanensis]GGE42585.1 hypothetical protein GCM10007276_19860 [Agaricicola taiwanensis]
MTDLIVAIGMVLAIEGLVFAAFPHATRMAMLATAKTPEKVLRATGIGSAILGVLIVWLIRG